MTFTIGQAAFPAGRLEPGLYVVATPIGNLGDVTIRALETLSGATLIACEDTRMTRRLLERYGIAARMQAYHEHNAREAGERLLAAIEGGASVALVSDAGTPLISDPGSRLVAEARRRGIAVWPIPGACAPIAALSAAGLPTQAFLFAGFLPHQQGERSRRLRELAHLPVTLAFFESPNRLARSLADIAEIMGEARELAICREITKLHEETIRGTAGELARNLAQRDVKGEVVLLVAPPAEEAAGPDPEALLRELLADHGTREAAVIAAEATGLARRDLYRLALELGREGNSDDG